jgi:hypothetical protein
MMYDELQESRLPSMRVPASSSSSSYNNSNIGLAYVGLQQERGKRAANGVQSELRSCSQIEIEMVRIIIEVRSDTRKSITCDLHSHLQN